MIGGVREVMARSLQSCVLLQPLTLLLYPFSGEEGFHGKYRYEILVPPLMGIGLAILGHALWNGSSWGIGLLTADVHWAVQFLLIFGWIFFLIFALWQISRRILASVLLDYAS